MMIIVAHYKQGRPIEVSCYHPYQTDDGDDGSDGDVMDIKDIKDSEAIVDRVFHQLYDDYGYPKALTIKYRGYDFDSDKNHQLFEQLYARKELQEHDGDIIESWNLDKTKFFGIYSKYFNNKILEWAMLDGNHNESFDGLRILNVIGYFDTIVSKVENSIKVAYYIKGKKVTPQQYIDHIKNISFTSVLGDSKQPQIVTLIIGYSALSHIKDNLMEAKKVLAPYNTQQSVIQALQVIDTVLK